VAKREGKTAWEIAEFYTKDFLAGMQELNLLPPENIAKATDYINEQIDFIRILKSKGYTYQIDDGIYFDTSKFSKYAVFAHLNLDEQKAGARVEHNSQKRNISDFALWKFSNPNTKRDMEWPTPPDLLDCSRATDVTSSKGPLEPELDMAPGPISSPERSRTSIGSTEAGEQVKMGFPGWHLECSVIAKTILGDTLDIHTGGIDHIPVHHTNEIAQSESANDARLSNYWLHNNFMNEKDRKISKSLGNGYTLSDLKEKGFSPMDFKMLVLQGHYRNEAIFSFESLQAAKNRLDSWRAVAALRHQVHETLKSQSEMNDDKNIIPSYAVPGAIIEAVSNDLGTPEALRIIDSAFNDIGNVPLARINQDSLIQLIETIDELLGLKLAESTPDISDEAKQIIIERKK
jgi:cysteinyl-tRNA synthetase